MNINKLLRIMELLISRGNNINY